MSLTDDESSDIFGLDAMSEEDIREEYENIRENDPWLRMDRRCVHGVPQGRGDNWNDVKKQVSILELNLGNPKIKTGKYYYVIKAEDPDNIYLFHSDDEIINLAEKKVRGHSSFLTEDEFYKDKDKQNVDNSECLVYYAGELVYNNEVDLPAVRAWSPASGHFTPLSINHEKVGLPLNKFVDVQGAWDKDDVKNLMKAGKKGKKKSRKSRKSRKLRKVRKHQGIIQSGGNKGRLNKGYRYSGKKLKNGLPQIIKCKKKL